MTDKQTAIRLLNKKWGANVLELELIHIFGLGKWNFINTEILELIQSLGTIEMIIPENFEFIVRRKVK